MSDNHFIQMLPNKSEMIKLQERFREDPRADKMNLTIGIYNDNQGKCPVLNTVNQAEKCRAEMKISKSSFNMHGSAEYHRAIKSILFPNLGNSQEDPRIKVSQTLGASGALYLSAQLLKYVNPTAHIWLSAPTWENHEGLFNAFQGRVSRYKYQAMSDDQIDLNVIIDDLEDANAGDVIVLHTCCHNPTGIDPDKEQWRMLAKYLSERKIIPILDFAYQGFAKSIPEDTVAIDILMDELDTILICNSFSKNMSIYDERVGALTLFSRDIKKVNDWHEIIRLLIRSSYSMPPSHGGFIVSHIINSPENNVAWQNEVSRMREDIDQKRSDLYSMLESYNIFDDVLLYRKHKGMFLCLDISGDDIEQLRKDYGIYLLDNGRVSVASLSAKHLSRFVESLAFVVRGKPKHGSYHIPNQIYADTSC